MKYNPSKIERKWQRFWETKKFYNAKDKSSKEKKYVLIEFPYPSGEGLHMGHLRPYIAGDVYSRFQRMNGFETMYPIGWDAFGLPAENYAIKNKIHPRVSTQKNIANAKKQLKSWGLSFDWFREINTTDPGYYKWTQWIFLQFYKAGLAYEATGLINWCSKDKTGLANEEVVNGCCERCGTPVEKKQLRQWYLKITTYADKLLDGLKDLNWPEPIKLQQQNWIGKSEGAIIKFPIFNSKFSKGGQEYIEVFTTRADTLFGATYLVIAPEHPMVTKFTTDDNLNKVGQYLEEVKKKTELERTNLDKSKTGVPTGGFVLNPINNEKIPVWVADYVVGWYGTGAVMAVPAHDERDWDFAKKYDLPVKMVVCPNYPDPTCPVLEHAFVEDAYLVDSAEFTGMKSAEARRKIVEKLKEKKLADFKNNYKLRDWVFSRQRYWGEPIPLIHCDKCGIVEVPEKDLPVLLPEIEKYEPTGTGESPLAAIESWVNTGCPKCGGSGKRETNTMPQWAGSSWYYLRYTDPKNKKQFADPKLLKHWLPVDVYFGGMEHATLHLLYSRFWHQFLYDQKLVPTTEPYAMRAPHGIILGPDGEKMSKSRGNVVNPQDVVERYGADTLRMFEMFLGPHEATIAWQEEGIVGVYRFLIRVWNFIEKPMEPKSTDEGVDIILNKATKEIGDDIKNFKFNTGVSGLMKLLNALEDKWLTKKQYGTFLKLLAPFAPHIAEELWQNLIPQDRTLKDSKVRPFSASIHLESWPKYDEALLVDELVDLVIQINGTKRDVLKITRGLFEEEVKSIVLNNENIKKHLAGKEIKKFIYIKDRLTNIVV